MLACKRQIFRIIQAPNTLYDSVIRKWTNATSHYRRDLCIFSGSRGQKATFVRGNEVPCGLRHCTFGVRFDRFGLVFVISSTIAIFSYGGQ